MQGGERDVLYAITIDPKQPISMELSPAGKRAATEAVERMLAELDSDPDSLRKFPDSPQNLPNHNLLAG